MAESVMIRVHVDFGRYVKELKKQLEEVSKKPVTDVDVTRFIAARDSKNIIVHVASKKSRKKNNILEVLSFRGF